MHNECELQDSIECAFDKRGGTVPGITYLGNVFRCL